MKEPPNKVGAGKGAGALSLHIERVGRALPDLYRSARFSLSGMRVLKTRVLKGQQDSSPGHSEATPWVWARKTNLFPFPVLPSPFENSRKSRETRYEWAGQNRKRENGIGWDGYPGRRSTAIELRNQAHGGFKRRFSSRVFENDKNDGTTGGGSASLCDPGALRPALPGRESSAWPRPTGLGYRCAAAPAT